MFSPLVLAVLVIKSRKNTAFRHRLFERLGVMNHNLKANGIVVHAASVGEVIAIKPFVDELLLAYPDLPITVTTFTPTGSAQVIKLFGDKVQHCYFPIDIFICSWWFLRKLKPQAIVFMETELWPNIIAQAANKKIKLLLINARLSAHSMQSYRKLLWLIKPSVNRFDKILPQSLSNLQNFIELGAKQEKCECLGNLKFDISASQTITDKQTELAAFLPQNRKIWIMASTHQGDEALALSVLKELQPTHPELLLVIVPRHPERFQSVAQLCAEQQINTVTRSSKARITDATQVWLLDSLGELMAAYALSDIVTMGGSFSEINGHNPLEPALFKKPIIVGPYMANFSEIKQQLDDVHGILSLTSTHASELAQTVLSLLNDESKQQQLGESAYQVVMNNQGASQQSVAALQEILCAKDAIVSVKAANSYYQYNSALIENFSPEMLSATYWQQQNAITGSAQGRGTTWFIQHHDQHWVLRHYFRGGLIGKFNKDSYVFTSVAASRAAKEFSLLNQMQTWQLPAPKPVAYQVVKHGMFYRADLLSSRIENAQDLVALLSKEALPEAVWLHIGATIKRFHDRGVYHHDLNAHNILLNAHSQAWLIDFDQGELRTIDSRWQQANLDRLLRSFRKEQTQLSQFYWQEEDWQMLLKGYVQ